ncbi:unnamed protein product [Angiostrongylus costaricensis]|uniref:Neur_chan_LBD domain-containing protein n=1 Tax=Angiostrongylus costaricensis TaxID=334426 RepID=A0A0R3PJC0_ANGCS|nr:unnamed protein product [Angiostrongylus costaricensis]
MKVPSRNLTHQLLMCARIQFRIAAGPLSTIRILPLFRKYERFWIPSDAASMVYYGPGIFHPARSRRSTSQSHLSSSASFEGVFFVDRQVNFASINWSSVDEQVWEPLAFTDTKAPL